MRVLCRYTLIMLFAGIYFGNSQVKIGDNLQLIDSSSLLELESSTRALVLTRVNENQMSAITPLNGALVYNTDAECIFMYSGDSWRNLCETNNINAIANNGLSLINGNSVQLGGQLIRPTTIQTDASSTQANKQLAEAVEREERLASANRELCRAASSCWTSLRYGICLSGC